MLRLVLHFQKLQYFKAMPLSISFTFLFFILFNWNACGQENAKVLYETHCSSCHKSNGKGMLRIYPPLLNSNWLQSDSTLINVVLKGLTGPIIVNDKKYKGEMPAFEYLSDIEIAEILTYVRKEFGQNGKEISVKEVSVQRLKLE